MKQVSQNYKTGKVKLETVAVPALKRGGVLVQTQYSVISAGTEGMKVKEAKMSYVGKARARPDQVKKVLRSVQQQGLMATYYKVMNKLDSLTPLGYSASGVVVAVASGAEEFQVGQRVACAGVGYANHAEVNFVPKNLVVPVPGEVKLEHAAFATVGAIALQGLRQAEMQLGETACVIGLGLLGQLVVQLLRASGVTVLGVDLIESRCTLAKQLGAAAALIPADVGMQDTVRRVTKGLGVDCVLITAGGNTNGPAELAVEIARDRGRVVDIGKTKLDLSWNDYYLKELDVRFSRSYGPGRYDPNYEEGGVDYPVGYVRWTERRNMLAFLDLAAQGLLQLDKIIDEIRPFEEAEQVYQELAEGKGSGLGVVFKHSESVDLARRLPAVRVTETQSTERVRAPDGIARFGMIGAGNYASSMLFPYFAEHKQARLIEIATATSLSAANATRKFNFERSGTDYKMLLRCDDIDAVVIATRHAVHSVMTAQSLRAGKGVYVEKPLAIDAEGLKLVWDAVIEASNDRLMVGFNRRFSPLIKQARKIMDTVRSPLVMHYRVHAGQLEAGSWYLDSPQHGSRFAGEAGHFFDVFGYLTNARPVSVVAKSLRPCSVTADDLSNIAVTVQYEDGSLGNLLYLTQGGIKLPKEHLEVFGGGKTVQLHNFDYLMVYEGTGQKKHKAAGLDKGQKNEVEAFVSAVAEGRPMPISLQCLFDTTLVTVAAEDSLRTGECVVLADYWKATVGNDSAKTLSNE